MPQVFIPPQWRDLTGGVDVISLPAGSLRQVIDSLEASFPGIRARACREEQIAPGLQVSIGGQLTSRGLRSRVDDDSEVHFLPAIGGG